jgi:hypothetical protein
VVEVIGPISSVSSVRRSGGQEAVDGTEGGTVVGALVLVDVVGLGLLVAVLVEGAGGFGALVDEPVLLGADGAPVGDAVPVAFGFGEVSFAAGVRCCFLRAGVSEVETADPADVAAGAAAPSAFEETIRNSSRCLVSPAARAVVTPTATRLTAVTAEVTVPTRRSPRSRSLGFTEATSDNIQRPRRGFNVG